MRSSVSVRWSLAARHCQRLFSKYLPPAAANPKNRLIVVTPCRELFLLYKGQKSISHERTRHHTPLHWVNRSTRWTFFPSLLHRSLFTLATAEQIFKKWNKSIFASDTESVKSGRCYTSILIYSITIIQQRVCKISFAAKKRFVQQIILNRQNYDKDNVNGQRFIKRTQCNAVFSKF